MDKSIRELISLNIIILVRKYDAIPVGYNTNIIPVLFWIMRIRFLLNWQSFSLVNVTVYKNAKVSEGRMSPNEKHIQLTCNYHEQKYRMSLLLVTEYVNNINQNWFFVDAVPDWLNFTIILLDGCSSLLIPLLITTKLPLIYLFHWEYILDSIEVFKCRSASRLHLKPLSREIIMNIDDCSNGFKSVVRYME